MTTGRINQVTLLSVKEKKKKCGTRTFEREYRILFFLLPLTHLQPKLGV